MSRLLLVGGQGSGPPVETYLPLGPDVNITVDANSIWSNQIGEPGIEALAPLADLVADTGCTISNTSIAGQTWAQMAANIADVNATWVEGKTNILMPGETRNTMADGITNAATCLAQIHDYVDAILAVHPWNLVMMGSLPSDGVPAATFNAGMIEVDNYVRDNLGEFQAIAFCGYRHLSPYYQDGLSRAGFMTSTVTCLEDFPGPYVHPVGFARELLARRMANVLQQIPAEAVT